MADKVFLHADRMDSFFVRFGIAMLNVQPEFRRTWHKDFAYCLDAPNVMPAGAVQYFDLSEEFHGAEQILCERPE